MAAGRKLRYRLKMKGVAIDSRDVKLLHFAAVRRKQRFRVKAMLSNKSTDERQSEIGPRWYVWSTVRENLLSTCRNEPSGS